MLSLDVTASHFSKWICKQWVTWKNFVVDTVGMSPAHFIDKVEHPVGDRVPAEGLPTHAVSTAVLLCLLARWSHVLSGLSGSCAYDVLNALVKRAFGDSEIILELETAPVPREPLNPRGSRLFIQPKKNSLLKGLIDADALAQCSRTFKTMMTVSRVALEPPPSMFHEGSWCTIAEALHVLLKIGAPAYGLVRQICALVGDGVECSSWARNEDVHILNTRMLRSTHRCRRIHPAFKAAVVREANSYVMTGTSSSAVVKQYVQKGRHLPPSLIENAKRWNDMGNGRLVKAIQSVLVNACSIAICADGGRIGGRELYFSGLMDGDSGQASYGLPLVANPPDSAFSGWAYSLPTGSSDPFANRRIFHFRPPAKQCECTPHSHEFVGNPWVIWKI